jgi:hypothetical protein
MGFSSQCRFGCCLKSTHISLSVPPLLKTKLNASVTLHVRAVAMHLKIASKFVAVLSPNF